MGRTILKNGVQKMAIPPGFLQELNMDMMEDLWFALAAAKDPEMLTASGAHSITDVFDRYLADVTWDDFWKAFPYELREQGSCLDELDALGLLLASPVNRSRFQRHFEQLACSATTNSTSGSGTSGSGRSVPATPRPASASSGRGSAPAMPPPTADAADRLVSRSPLSTRAVRYNSDALAHYHPSQHEEWMRLGPQAIMRPRMPPGGHQQQQPAPAAGSGQLTRAVPLRRQQQQQQQHMAFVSPVAPGQLSAATQTAPASAIAAAFAPAAPVGAASAVAGTSAGTPAGHAPLNPLQEPQQLQQQGQAQVQQQQQQPEEPPPFLEPSADVFAAARLVAVAAAADAQVPGSSNAIARETLAFAGISRAALHEAAAAARGTGEAAAAGAVVTAMAAAAAAAAGRGSAAPARLTGTRRTWLETCAPSSHAYQHEQQSTQAAQQERRREREQGGAAAAAANSHDIAAAADAAAGGAVGPAGSSVGVRGGAGGAAAGDGEDAGCSSAVKQDLSAVWRAVHEWLTSEDEDLLVLVGQVVPYSLYGRQLRPECDTRQQLQALADNRPVPKTVISAVADRLLQPAVGGDSQLVQLTARSGFSRSAAAAAAVLECCDRQGMLPVYIPLTGLCTEDDLESAVMRGLFGSSGGGSGSSGSSGSSSSSSNLGVQDAGNGHEGAAGAGAGAAAAVEGGGGPGLAEVPGRQQAGNASTQQEQQGQQQQQQQPAEPRGAAQVAAPAAASRPTAPMPVPLRTFSRLDSFAQPGRRPEPTADRQQQQQQMMRHSLGLAHHRRPPAALQAEQQMLVESTRDPADIGWGGLVTQLLAEADAAIGHEAGDDHEHGEEELMPAAGSPGPLRNSESELLEPLDPAEWLAMYTHAAATAATYGREPSGGGGSSGGGGDGDVGIVGPRSRSPCEPVDQLAAHLTLLGRCGAKQPLLLLLDEVDAAMMCDDGRVLRELLMRLLYHLPQAVVAITSSSTLDAWRDAAVLRQQEPAVVLQLLDGQLMVINHQLPRSPLGLMHCYNYC